MKVWVNGEERLDLTQWVLPEDMLTAIDDEAKQAGSILSELRVDDVVVSREYFCSLAFGEWETASFTLTPFADFLQDTLTTAVSYSHKLTNGIESLANRLECADPTAVTGLAEVIDGVNWLLGIYSRSRNFTPVPLRLDEDSALESELLKTLEQLLHFQFMREKAANQSNQDSNNHVMASCLREDLLPRVQMLEHRVADLADAARLPMQ